MGVRYPTSGAVSAASSLTFNVETPVGLVNSANTTYTLAHQPRTPLVNNIAVFLNGVLQSPNVDYTIVGLVVTFAVAPTTGDVLLVIYVALV